MSNILGWVSLALLVSGDVLVVGSELGGGELEVVEGLVHPTSVTSLVTLLGGAIDELLLSEISQRVSSLSPGCFGGCNGRESPAGSALSLVLNLVDNSLGSPVDRCWEVVALWKCDDVSWALGESESGVLGLELFLGQIGELVECNLVVDSLLLLGDSLEGLGEDRESVGELLRGLVLLSMLGCPLQEGLVDFWREG